jgi:hypothetical protein
MFISTKDKEAINFSIQDLYSRVEKLGCNLNTVLDQLNTKEEEVSRLTEAQRKKRNAYASAYYYKKKAEKAAQPKE